MENQQEVPIENMEEKNQESANINFPDVNQVSIAGRLQHDPPMRWTKKGVPVTNFLLVVTPDPSANYFESHPRQETVVSVVVWAKQALQCKKYLKKGSAVMIHGELQSMPNAEPEDGFYPVQLNAQWIQYLDKNIKVEDIEDNYDNLETGPNY